MNSPTVGIIGYGDFTKFMLKHLEPHTDIAVSSRLKSSGQASVRTKFTPVKKVLACPIIIPSIPAQYIEEFFTENLQNINPQALVIDVCSVKVKPLQTLERILPKSVQIIGTHPLFGPASAQNDLSGKRIVLCPVRVNKDIYFKVSEFCRLLGLTVFERTPEEHDKSMAYAQGLSHYIGRVMDMMQIPDTDLLTDAYRDLLDMKRIQGQDSWALFNSIVHENSETPAVLQAFKSACQQLDEQIAADQDLTDN